jgi:hypothetical protein
MRMFHFSPFRCRRCRRRFYRRVFPAGAQPQSVAAPE